MSPRHTRAPFVAAYQLMASYLVWDFRDLLREGQLNDPNAQERLDQFIEMLDSAQRAIHPAYPASRAEGSRKGHARAERTERLASLTHDEELLNLVILAYGSDDQAQAESWATEASSVLGAVKEAEWAKPEGDSEQRFIEDRLEPFLRRLQRIDQLEVYRPPKRSGLTRR